MYNVQMIIPLEGFDPPNYSRRDLYKINFGKQAQHLLKGLVQLFKLKMQLPTLIASMCPCV